MDWEGLYPMESKFCLSSSLFLFRWMYALHRRPIIHVIAKSLPQLDPSLQLHSACQLFLNNSVIFYLVLFDYVSNKAKFVLNTSISCSKWATGLLFLQLRLWWPMWTKTSRFSKMTFIADSKLLHPSRFKPAEISYADWHVELWMSHFVPNWCFLNSVAWKCHFSGPTYLPVCTLCLPVFNLENTKIVTAIKSWPGKIVFSSYSITWESCSYVVYCEPVAISLRYSQ